MKRNRVRYPLLVVVCLIGACGDDGPSGPSPEEIAGSYEADVLIFRDDGDTRNLLEEGAFVDVTLHEDGTTEGEFYIPALTGGADLSGSLNGTWELDGDIVMFQHSPGSFMSDAPFMWGGGGVLGTRFYLADGVLDLTLSRGDPLVFD